MNEASPKTKREFIFKMAQKPLPQDLTSYDFLKTLAIVLMIVDHIGLYFFPDADADPDNNIFRMFGRMCVPIWFFLIGYAQSRDLGPMIIAGALLLFASDLLIGRVALPVNVLVSIIIVRLVLDFTMGFAQKGTVWLVAVCAVLVVLMLPLSFFWEYGTLGIVLAMLGYMVRHQGDDKERKAQSFRFLMFCIPVFILYQQLFFGFTSTQFMIMILGSTAVFFLVLNFKSATYPALSAKMPAPACAFFRVCGRHTLEIYVIHLLAFKFIALSIGMDGYDLFQPNFLGEQGDTIKAWFQGTGE